MKSILLIRKSTCKINLFIYCLMLFAATGCNKDDGPEPQIEPKSSEKQITSFVFLITNNAISTNIVATIDEANKTITAAMPVGTDLSGLLPEVKISALASISHDTAQNFTDPIDYTVTAEDGSTTVYTVTITALLTQRQILQTILNVNPNHIISWDLATTENLGDLAGVTLNTQGQIIELSLNFKKLNLIPTEIGQLTNITTLELAGNELTEIPSEIGQLIKLERMSLYQNQLTEIPLEIGKFANLTRLTLQENQLTEIPQEIGQLTNLTVLQLYNNQLTEIPPEIVQLTKLEYLELFSNALTAIPSEIGQLINLKRLSLYQNQLTAIPPGIGQLTSLTVLSLQGNQLAEIPPEIGQLSNLIELFLSNNQLAEIPPEIGFLTKLENLTINDNNLNIIPLAICNLKTYNNPNMNYSTDLNVTCATTSQKDALIQIYSANPGNTLGWGVDNYPGVKFNDISNPTEMTMNNKNLTRIPEDINVFGDLEVLNINSNDISSFPEVSTNLRKLTTITAASNNLTTVPDSFQLLTNLTLLSITNNPMSSIPQGVCDLQIANGGILTLLTDPGEGCQ